MRELCTVGDVVGKTYLPQGYVKANGATVQRADYPRLVNLADRYNLWTTTPATYPALFGEGDGSATMVLPDWRGVVMRFVDDGKGYDPGRLLGTYQEDLFKSHVHQIGYRAYLGYGNTGQEVGTAHSYYTPTAAAGGTETRGKNIAVLAVMRY